jgi:hypothetical protein
MSRLHEKKKYKNEITISLSAVAPKNVKWDD